jgi:hypothetical protein
VVVKLRDPWILIAGGVFLGLVFLFPGVLQDIPDWGWWIISVVFLGACVVGLWRRGVLGTVAKRGGIALLLLIPFTTMIAVAPGEPQHDLPLPLVVALVTVPLGILFVIAIRTGFFTSLKEMFAKHPPACEKCLEARKDLVWLEPPAGPAVHEQKRSLCPPCVWDEVETQISGLSNRLLAAEPVRDANGYYSLNADGIAEWWGLAEDRRTKENTRRRVVSTVGQIVDGVSGPCEECGAAEANVCWVPGEAFSGEWDRFSELLGDEPDELLNDASLRHLCGGCAARSAREAAQANRVRLHLVSSPTADTLVMLPGEA